MTQLIDNARDACAALIQKAAEDERDYGDAFAIYNPRSTLEKDDAPEIKRMIRDEPQQKILTVELPQFKRDAHEVNEIHFLLNDVLRKTGYQSVKEGGKGYWACGQAAKNENPLAELSLMAPVDAPPINLVNIRDKIVLDTRKELQSIPVKKIPGYPVKYEYAVDSVFPPPLAMQLLKYYLKKGKGREIVLTYRPCLDANTEVMHDRPAHWRAVISGSAIKNILADKFGIPDLEFPPLDRGRA